MRTRRIILTPPACPDEARARQPGELTALYIRASNEGETKVREDLTITEKAPRAFSWLKAPTSAFPFKTQ